VGKVLLEEYNRLNTMSEDLLAIVRKALEWYKNKGGEVGYQMQNESSIWVIATTLLMPTSSPLFSLTML
jgi:hypothetical protein